MLRCHARRLLYLESPSESNPFAPTPFYFFLFFFFSFPFSPVAGKFFFFHSNFEFRVTHETFTWPRLRCLRRTTTYVTEIENLLFSVSPSLSVFTLTTVFPVKKKKNKKKGTILRKNDTTRWRLFILLSIINFHNLFLKFRRTPFSIFHYYLKLLLNFLFLSKPIVETKFSCLSP